MNLHVELKQRGRKRSKMNEGSCSSFSDCSESSGILCHNNYIFEHFDIVHYHYLITSSVRNTFKYHTHLKHT